MSRRRRGKAKKYSGNFVCTECKRVWTSENAKFKTVQNCFKCGTAVLPTDLTLISKIDCNGFEPVKDTRYFGEYECLECRRVWFSAHSWLGFGQMCKRCNIMVGPHKLRKLEKPDGLNRNDWRKKHEQSLCGRCEKLGTNCSRTKTIPK